MSTNQHRPVTVVSIATEVSWTLADAVLFLMLLVSGAMAMVVATLATLAGRPGWRVAWQPVPVSVRRR